MAQIPHAPTLLKPPPPPTAAAAAEGEEGEFVEVESDEEEVAQSTIAFDRMFDLYWTHSPTDMIWVIISRRERKKKAKSRMPLILRNLAPDSTFDPREKWEAEKPGYYASLGGGGGGGGGGGADDDVGGAAEDKKGKKGKPEKGKKGKHEKAGTPLSKADAIREKNKEEMRSAEVAKDNERLDNAAKAAKKGNMQEVLAVKTLTQLGALRKLLMILEGSLQGGDLPATFDVLWAIEASKVFRAAEAEVVAAKEAKEEKKEKEKEKDKKKDKKDDKKKVDKKEAKVPPLSEEAELVKEFKKELKKAREAREKIAAGGSSGGGLVEFQLTKMHDRLPPLSIYNRTFKLDSWQCRVLDLVDRDKSAIVCAPTSSGKTVISTYVAVKIAEEAKLSSAKNEGGVLFVVPSEPLVWQVAAMFEKMLPGQVALCTDLMAYRPESATGQSNIVVGTPKALESALSKVRGLVGSERKRRGSDYAQMAGGFGFRYAVFDEVHSLDGSEGGALQRLMRLAECPFLALSATIGNADSLQAFWTTVRGGHKDCVPALVSAGRARDPNVHLEKHEGRFINLQRLSCQPTAFGLAAGRDHAGIKAKDMGRTVELKPLHPCAAVSVEILRGKSFDNLSISFTPRDAFDLWAVLLKHCADPADKAAVAHLSPTEFFSNFGDVATHQITLAQAKEYEHAMKGALEAMAAEPDREGFVRRVLAEFAVEDSSLETETTQLFAFAVKCRDEKLFPCLCFQLDTFKCVEMYKELLGTLETRQKLEFPSYYKDLEDKAEAERLKAEGIAKAIDSKRKAKGARDEDGERMKSGGAGGDEAPEVNFIDTAAPHPDYVLAPPTSRISTVEFEDILEEMKKDKEELKKDHPLARGLRRGIGIYIEDVGMSVYRRVVQRLAQQGKLAMVFSDHSLAYGVNMPFRTCAFCGDMAGLLTPLMAQQMSGRTGRRGLDTQGNIVYLGMGWGEISGLILGQVPDISGEKPIYPTIALQRTLSDFVDRRSGRMACEVPFSDFQMDGGAAFRAAGSYFDMSEKLMVALGMVGEDQAPLSAAKEPGLTTCWELRGNIAESLAVLHALPLFMADFVVKKPPDYAEKVTVQVEFFARLLHFVDRHPPYEGVPGLPPNTSFADLGYITKYPERLAAWDQWEAHVAAGQARFDSLDDELRAELERTGAMADVKLPVPMGDPIDSTIFVTLLNNKLPLDLPSMVKHDLKRRLYHVGTTIIKMHNCLAQPGEYQGLEMLLRKSFARLKYVLTDAIKNETSLKDQSGGGSAAATLEAAAGAAAEALGALSLE